MSFEKIYAALIRFLSAELRSDWDDDPDDPYEAETL